MSDWRSRGACFGSADPVFFPTRGGSRTAAVVRAAKVICAGCPVRADCLADALESSGRADFGIWGGTTVRERRELRKDITPG